MKKSIASLLDLQEWIIYRFEMNEHHIDVYAGRPKKEARCPDCHALSHRVHSRTSRWRPKLHTWVDRKPVFLWVRPRRFRCPACGKVFTERLPGIGPWATKIKMLKRISFGFRNRAVYVRKVLLAFVPVACLVA